MRRCRQFPCRLSLLDPLERFWVTWIFWVIERQKSSAERASSTGSAQCLLFSRRRSYIPAAVPVSIMSSDVFVQQLFPVFQADTTVKTAAVPEVVLRL